MSPRKRQWQLPAPAGNATLSFASTQASGSGEGGARAAMASQPVAREVEVRQSTLRGCACLSFLFVLFCFRLGTDESRVMLLVGALTQRAPVSGVFAVVPMCFGK